MQNGRGNPFQGLFKLRGGFGDEIFAEPDAIELQSCPLDNFVESRWLGLPLVGALRGKLCRHDI